MRVGDAVSGTASRARTRAKPAPAREQGERGQDRRGPLVKAAHVMLGVTVSFLSGLVALTLLGLVTVLVIYLSKWKTECRKGARDRPVPDRRRERASRSGWIDSADHPSRTMVAGSGQRRIVIQCTSSAWS